jgi:hypothetical protein
VTGPTRLAALLVSTKLCTDASLAFASDIFSSDGIAPVMLRTGSAALGWPYGQSRRIAYACSNSSDLYSPHPIRPQFTSTKAEHWTAVVVKKCGLNHFLSAWGRARFSKVEYARGSMQRIRCRRGGAEIKNGSVDHLPGLRDSRPGHSRRPSKRARDLATGRAPNPSGEESLKPDDGRDSGASHTRAILKAGVG